MDGLTFIIMPQAGRWNPVGMVRRCGEPPTATSMTILVDVSAR